MVMAPDILWRRQGDRLQKMAIEVSCVSAAELDRAASVPDLTCSVWPWPHSTMMQRNYEAAVSEKFTRSKEEEKD